MTTLGVADFSGMMPLRDPVLLPDNNAQLSLNTWLYKGSVRGFRLSPTIVTLARPTTSKQVYRIPLTNELTNWASSLWMEFPDPYISVIPSPVVGDQFNRYYFFPSSFFVADSVWTSRFSVPFYAPLTNVIAGGPYYTLGIPTPGVTPTVVPAAGGSPQEVRSYVYTFISAYGEEGPPSPPTIGTGNPVGTWTITVFNPTAGQETNRNLTQVRLYRSVTDSSGNATFYEVVTLNLTTPSAGINYSDSFFSADIVNNLVLGSLLFTGPPTGLDSVVLMANGIMAGFTNMREIWFSAAFQPHAWPDTYAITANYNIVALNAIGSSLSVLTEGQPAIATGTTPDTMTIGQVTANEPCISRGSVYAAGEGTYYASPNGLVLLNTSGTMNVTMFSMEREFWESMLPELWASARQGISYTAFIKGASSSTTVNINNTLIEANGLIIDHIEKNVPCSLIQNLTTGGETVINMYWDNVSGQLFAVHSTGVKWWMPPSNYPVSLTGSLTPYGSILPWVYKTKKFRMQKPEQLKAFKIQFIVPPEITISPPVFPGNTAQNQVFNPATQYLIIRVYADGKFILVREVTKSNEVLLITNGFKATFWEFQIESQVYVYLLKVSSSVKELRKA